MLALVPAALQLAAVFGFALLVPTFSIVADWTLLWLGLAVNVVSAVGIYFLVRVSLSKQLDAMAAAEQKLSSTEENRQKFISMVSHDLRSPLTSLSATLAVIESESLGQLPEQAKTRIQSAQAIVQRLTQLTTELLDIRRLEEGKMDMSIRACQLSSIIQQSVETVEDLAAGKSIKIEKTDLEDVRVFADENRIVQVLVNLLSNAIKFSHKGGVVKIVLEQNESDIEVQVIDSGIGMSLKNRSAVFDRFRQAEGGRSAGGSGLGLNIAKAIIEEHGGAIGFDSREGSGSKFWFRLAKVPSASASF